MKIGRYELSDSHTHVMGILNITPDSFSDGGQYNTVEDALRRAEKMQKDGAAILDLGGESTRPGYQKISDEEEIARVCPVIEAIHARIDLPISVDTYKANVAKAAVHAGADLINDIWGLQYDHGEMADVISKTGVSCCLMHNRLNPEYTDFKSELLSDMNLIIETALKAEIQPEKIILDPGIGFAKNYDQNLMIMQLLDAYKGLGYPVLIGASRKSMIGLTLNVPVTERLEGTLAVSVLSAYHKMNFVRVHDVLENVRAIQMTEAMMHVGE